MSDEEYDARFEEARAGYEALRSSQEHVDGIPWHDAPVPPRLHRCKPQTKGWVNFFTQVDRCACGAIRMDGGRWMERNARRKTTTKET